VAQVVQVAHKPGQSAQPPPFQQQVDEQWEVLVALV
jgi:hypothetical protein